MKLSKKNLPKHVAIIMDGNRRWAEKKNLPVIEGHRRGVERITPLVRRSREWGIKHITFWVWSTENWERPTDFVIDIMKVFRENLRRDDIFNELFKNGGEMHIFGDIRGFPKDIQKALEKRLAVKPEEKKINVNFALNYGGRAEILKASRKVAREVKKGKLEEEKITEKVFSKYLYTSGQPDPDLIIRTGGEKRLSGFLLWQGAYAELYFTNVLFPDFTPKEFEKAILEYQRRQRRFGR